jgi:hypothetical protein
MIGFMQPMNSALAPGADAGPSGRAVADTGAADQPGSRCTGATFTSPRSVSASATAARRAVSNTAAACMSESFAVRCSLRTRRRVGRLGRKPGGVACLIPAVAVSAR